MNTENLENMMIVPREDLQILFDLVVGSMDFSSGFMETDDVEALRRFAKILNVDPIDATPSNFTSQYTHKFKPKPPSRWPGVEEETQKLRARTCIYCELDIESSVHIND